MRGLALLIGLAALAPAAGAQRDTPRVQLEARVDAIAASETALHLGLGGSVPMGTYVRTGAVIAAGYDIDDVYDGASYRVDAVTRFLLDPLLQFKRAPYAGGGVSLRHDPGSRNRAFLLLVVGYEGAPRRGVLPSVELGLGGGARVGVVLRQAIPGRR